MEYSRNTEYGKTKYFRFLLSPDREEAAIFIGMNKVMLRALDRDGTSIHPYKVLNRFACPYDKKSNNYTMDQGLKEEHKQYKDRIVEFFMNIKETIKREDLRFY